MKQKYFVNDDVFDIITPQGAYWLGMLMADGCITLPNKVRLTLQNSDKYHLEEFLKFVGSDRIRLYPNGSCSQAYFLSKKITERVIDLGIIPRKSTIDTMADSDLAAMPSFWLGVMDGDGCITRFSQGKNRPLIPSVVFVGCKSLMGQLSEFIRKTIDRSAKPMRHERIWAVKTHGRSAVSFLRVLYSFDVKCLQRKQKLAQEAFEWTPAPMERPRRERLTKTCSFCECEVTRKPEEFSDHGIFCSRQCWYDWMRRTKFSTKTYKQNA